MRLSPLASVPARIFAATLPSLGRFPRSLVGSPRWYCASGPVVGSRALGGRPGVDVCGGAGKLALRHLAPRKQVGLCEVARPRVFSAMAANSAEYAFVANVLSACEPSFDASKVASDVQGVNTRLRALVESCGAGSKTKWLGKGSTEEGYTAQWLSLKLSELSDTEPKADFSILGDLNTFLETRSFLVCASRPALADVSMFWALRKSLTPDDASKVPNVVRWFLQMQGWGPVRKALGGKWPLLEISLAEPWNALNQCAGLAIESASAAAGGAASADKKKGGGAAAAAGKQKQGEKKPKKEKKQAAAPAPASDQPDVTKLDIRVGQITKIWKHPESDALLCEEIDVGEDKVRPIGSGIQKFYPEPEKLTGRKVIVLCNLKPRKLGGYNSHGMVMCASSADKSSVELVDPGPDAVVGERISFDGIEGTFEPATPAQVGKKKVFELVAPNLKTDANCTPLWVGPDGKEHKFKTSTGNCSVPTIAGGSVS